MASYKLSSGRNGSVIRQDLSAAILRCGNRGFAGTGIQALGVGGGRAQSDRTAEGPGLAGLQRNEDLDSTQIHGTGLQSGRPQMRTQG
jgi:hypothetical protein